ncbi:hypothetical protein [Lysinibacillus sp. 54212]|uniref:hypothetical protein n=1 Tax=Lysinibacillus sp. 54212 TaxID=3119829 RepID=UPI002FC88E24
MITIVTSKAFDNLHALLEDEDFYEEVVAEATAENFLLTCSIGIDDDGEYITWNLFYKDGFSESETIPLSKCKFDVFDLEALNTEMKQTFLRLLGKAANNGDLDAAPSQDLLSKLV